MGSLWCQHGCGSKLKIWGKPPWVLHVFDPVPPVNISIPTTIGSKMGGEFPYQPKWDPKTVLTTTTISMNPQFIDRGVAFGPSKSGLMSPQSTHGYGTHMLPPPSWEPASRQPMRGEAVVVAGGTFGVLLGMALLHRRLASASQTCEQRLQEAWRGGVGGVGRGGAGGVGGLGK